MKGQKGSILAGVLALSIAMTAAAGGYVLLAGNTAGTRLDSMEDLRLHYAAEAGAQLGLRWLKAYDANDYGLDPLIWDKEIHITPPGYKIDNLSVQVSGIPTPGGQGKFQIVSKAISLDQKVTFTITWSINSAVAMDPPDMVNGIKSIPYSDNWIESYSPGNP